MLSLVRDKQAELVQLCARHKVRRLALFGSGTDNRFDADRSDLDFAVAFDSPTPSAHKESYFGLLADLEALFGRRIDLVEYESVRNPYFFRQLVHSEVVLYDAA